MARGKIEEVKPVTPGWSETADAYKFLKPGAPFGYAYFVGNVAFLTLTKKDQDELFDNNVITKI